MIRRFVSRLWSYKGRIKVGVDNNGNCYYVKQEFQDGAMVEKRWMEFKGEPDPTVVPVEWTSWLSGRRKGAPTPEEIELLEAHRRNAKKMAELYEEKEKERRLKEQLTLEGVNSEHLSIKDMEVMMQQISGGEVAEKGDGNSVSRDVDHTRYTKGRGVRDSSEATVWQPNRVTKGKTKERSSDSKHSTQE